jgi:hypothetical protein
MISAELAAHPISTKRGLTALCRRASRRGISYYIRYETQTYSLTAIGLLFAPRPMAAWRCGPGRSRAAGAPWHAAGVSTGSPAGANGSRG